MAVNTAQLPGWVTVQDITTLLAAGSLTITSAKVFKTGSVTVIQLNYSDSSIGYIKMKQGRIKIGGADNQFDTGTEVLWQS